MTAFVDYAKISCKAGDGGDGCLSFRREKYVPFGGPDGGNGGSGGHVYLRADPAIVTLLDCKLRPHQKAGNGKHGRGKNMHGKNGADCIVAVPLGTVATVLDAEENEVAQFDLTAPEQLVCVAAGGNGGRGNAVFATATNRAPRRCEEGGEGERRAVILELKMIADAGLIGLPNAGKSTLLAHLTAATPKIAPYPFTTLHPNLGMMDAGYSEQVTLADIPGLIEGAHRGQGLGHRFLRHIERTRALVHLIALDPDAMEFEDLWHAYSIVRHELASYSEALISRPELVVINKLDLLPAEQLPAVEAHLIEFKVRGVEALAVSAAGGQGLELLRVKILELLAPNHAEQPAEK